MRIFMKKIIFILLLSLVTPSSILATDSESYVPISLAVTLSIPYLCNDDLLSTRCVSKPIKAAVDEYLYRITRKYLNVFEVRRNPFAEHRFKKFQYSLIPQILGANEFVLMRRDHPFNPSFQAHAQIHDLTWGHASLLLEAPEFKSDYDSIKWEDQTNWMIYAQRDFNIAAVQTQMHERIAQSQKLYIPIYKLLDHLLEDATFKGHYSRVLISGPDYVNENNDNTLAEYFKTHPQSTLVVDMVDGIQIPHSESLKHIHHWVFTDTTQKGAFADWFLNSRILPEDFTLELPARLKPCGMGFLRAATLPQNYRLQMPLDTLKINYYFLEVTKISSGFKLYLPPHLESIGNYFFFKSKLPANFTMHLPASLKHIEERFFYKAILNEGFSLQLHAGIKIDKGFMDRIKIPEGCEIIGLDAVLKNLQENEGTLSQALPIHVIKHKGLIEDPTHTEIN